MTKIAAVHESGALAGLPRGRIQAPSGARVIAGWESAALLGVLVIAYGLRQELLGARSLWFDEAFSLDVARRTFPEMVRVLRTMDAHPIGYYALLSLWIRWLGTGLAQMRSLSLLFGMAAVLLTWRLGRQFFSPLVGIVAAAVVAVNPFQIIASNEMRMYPLLTCLVLASTWSLWGAAKEPLRARRWVGYGVSVALMAYTSYFSFFLLPAQALWVFLSLPARRALTYLCVAGVAAIVLYAPWIPYALTLPDRIPHPWRQPMNVDYLSNLIATQTFGGFLFHLGNYHVFGGLAFKYHPLLLFPFVVLMGAGLFAVGRLNPAARSLVGLSWGAPLALLLVASLVFGRMAAFPRHLVFLQPFAALCLAAGIIHLREAVAAAPRALVPLLGLLLVLTFMYPAVDDAQGNPEYQYYRYDLAAKFVKDLYKPDDAVIYFPHGTGLPFRYYFDPPGEQIFIGVDPHHWSKAAVQPSIRRVADFLEKHKGDRVWLIFSGPWPEGSLDDLTSAIKNTGFRQGPVEEFRGVWVTLFIRPTPQANRGGVVR